jgi:hypothetical protein
MPASTVGTEIEIAPAGGAHHQHGAHDHGHTHHHAHDSHDHGHRPHVAVVDRPVASGSTPSLVFPELVEGSYELFDKGADEVLLTVEIRGGEVTFVDWQS